MIPAMPLPATSHTAPQALARGAAQWLAGWWRIIHLGGVLLALALTPATYRGDDRAALARHVWLGCAPLIPWFALLSALISVVLVRIVVVTAVSYGLSRYALEMVVRVLVLELIPLTTALFVSVRCTMPYAQEIGALRSGGSFEASKSQGVDALRREVLPRAVTGVFCMVMLAAVACVVALLITYLAVYGFTPWGYEPYTRTVGRVFSPVVTTVFSLKILLLGLAVALIPIASVLYDLPLARSRASAELRGLVRLFAVILLIEAVSLIGNYY